jgi:hypothetical protein
MAGNIDVGITLSLSNNAAPGLKRAGQEATNVARKAATATQAAANRAAQAAERGAATQRNSYQRLSQARERLGLRSEHAIQREIQRTQAAYNRLARDGSRSFREQARAAEAARTRITQLSNEMGKPTARQKALGALKFGAALGAGTAAAAYTLKDPAQKAVDFDYRLANMVNTAFAERDTAGRKLGMRELEEAVNNAVRQGGGTRESAAGALDALIASGAVSSGAAVKMLPQLVRAATAANTDVGEIANIGIRGMQNFGIKEDEFLNLINMAIAGGQAGGFELSNMARWLPQQMAAAKMSGMSGRADFAALVALNQAAAITAGTKDEAGNNVVDLLSKINSQDTAGRVKEVMGVNLSGYLQKKREKGVSSIDAFGELMMRNVQKDRRYQALQGRLAALDPKDKEGQRATLESMTAIAQGSAFGKVIHDRQAMAALIAMMNNQGYMQDVRRQVQENDVSRGGAIDKNFELLSSTTGYALRMAAEEKDMAQKAAMDKLTPAIGEASEMFARLSREYPLLAGATALATTALTAFAGAAGLATMALGGKGAIGAAAGAASGVARGAASRIAAARAAPTILASLGAAGAGTAAAGLVTAGAAGYGIGSVANLGINRGIQAVTGDEHATLGTWLYDWFNKNKEDEVMKAFKPPEPPPQPPVEVDTRLSIMLDRGLLLQRQDTRVTGGNARIDTGNIMDGAP